MAKDQRTMRATGKFAALKPHVRTENKLQICSFKAVKLTTKDALKQLQLGLKQYKKGDEQSAAKNCSEALSIVLADVERLVIRMTSFAPYEHNGKRKTLTARQAMSCAKEHLVQARFFKKERVPTYAFYSYYSAFFVLCEIAANVAADEKLPFYSMLAEVLHSLAKLCGALINELWHDAAELQVVALVITEYVLGPATRKSLRNRMAATRMYFEAAKYAKQHGDKAGLKANVRQAKKYGADSVHAARYIQGYVSLATLSAYRLYLQVQEERYRVEKYTDENWDFNVIHESYTFLLEQLNVSW